MRKLLNLATAAAIAASAFVATPLPARAADATYASEPDFDGVCAAPSVLGKIKRRFSYQVRHVPDLPDVRIQDFRKIHQHRYEPATEDSPIGRRYCGATVDLSDGSSRDVWYLIEEGMGFAAKLDSLGLAGSVVGSNVEFCVDGFDRWNVYNGRCRVLR